jgi:predicted PurR-regulated permease PerM
VLAATVLVLSALALAVALVAPSVADQAQKLAEQLPALAQPGALVKKIPLPGFLESYRGRIEFFAAENLKASLPFAKNAGMQVFGFAGNAIFLVLIPILALIFVKDGGRIRAALLREIGPAASRSTVAGILSDLHETLGGYVRALGLLCLAALVAYGAFFAVTGVPYGILLAAIAAVLEIIPVVGPLAAAVIALFVAGVAGYDHLLWIAAFIVCYRIFQDYVLSPYLMHGSVGVHPALVIFGLLAGEQLGGVAGIFLSIPAVASLIILEKHIRARP